MSLWSPVLMAVQSYILSSSFEIMDWWQVEGRDKMAGEVAVPLPLLMLGAVGRG